MALHLMGAGSEGRKEALTSVNASSHMYASVDPGSVLVGVALGHLTLVCSEGSQYLTLLPLRHVEVVERSRKLSRDFVEDLGRDLQSPMGLF